MGPKFGECEPWDLRPCTLGEVRFWSANKTSFSQIPLSRLSKGKQFLYYVLTYASTNVTLSVSMYNGKFSVKILWKKRTSGVFHSVYCSLFQAFGQLRKIEGGEVTLAPSPFFPLIVLRVSLGFRADPERTEGWNGPQTFEALNSKTWTNK